MTLLTRRKILTGLLAAPVVVRAGLLMPVRPVVTEYSWVMGMDLGGVQSAAIVGVAAPRFDGDPVFYWPPIWYRRYAAQVATLKTVFESSAAPYSGPRISDATGQ